MLHSRKAGSWTSIQESCIGTPLWAGRTELRNWGGWGGMVTWQWRPPLGNRSWMVRHYLQKGVRKFSPPRPPSCLVSISPWRNTPDAKQDRYLASQLADELLETGRTAAPWGLEQYMPDLPDSHHILIKLHKFWHWIIGLKILFEYIQQNIFFYLMKWSRFYHKSNNKRKNVKVLKKNTNNTAVFISSNKWQSL